MTGGAKDPAPEARRRPHHTDARRIARAESLAELLDARFTIPGTSWRFGLDGLLGLIPGAGDLLTAILAAIIVLDAIRLGCSKRTIARMLMNIGIDAIAGAVPVVGDVFDVAYKANLKNLRLMQADIHARGREPGGPSDPAPPQATT